MMGKQHYYSNSVLHSKSPAPNYHFWAEEVYFFPPVKNGYKTETTPDAGKDVGKLITHMLLVRL